MKIKRQIKNTLFICGVIVLLFTACSRDEGKVPPVENPSGPTQSGEEGEEPNVADPSQTLEDPDTNSETPPEENEDTPGQETPANPAKPPSGTGDKPTKPTPPARDSQLDAYWTRLDEIAQSAQTFYTEYFSKTRLVSKNGLLYNLSSNEVVNAAYLSDYEGLNKQYRGLDCDILLINGSDLQAYSSLTVKDSDAGMTVFVAQRHPTEDKYLIVSANSAGGILSSAQYQSVLGKYNQNHGSIQTLTPGGEEYERILSFIKMYESNYSKYFVRSIQADGKYAMVILSSQMSTAEVKQYILRKNGNLWEVVMDGIENEARVPVAINKKLPDYNLDMLPSFSINDYKNSIKTTFLDVMPSMVNNGFINAAEDIYYIGGTNEYCYVVTLTGERILCVYQNGGWYPQYINTAAQARSIILEADKFGPAFIVLDQ